MEQKSVGNSDTASEARVSIAQASHLVRSIAGPAFDGDYVKQRMGRAFDALVQYGFTWNRVRDLWHKEPRIALRPGEIELLARIAQEREIEEADARQRLERLAAEAQRLKADILRARRELAPRQSSRPGRPAASASQQPDQQSLPTGRHNAEAGI